MSRILARLCVREPHGIRRFLYPLSALLRLPAECDPDRISLMTAEGEAVPMQASRLGGQLYRLDFAVSLAPQQTVMVHLCDFGSPLLVNDPMHQSWQSGLLQNTQQRFEIGLRGGLIADVVYDGAEHLRAPMSVLRSAGGITEPLPSAAADGFAGPLALWHRINAAYSNGDVAEADTMLTACKSWATVSLDVEEPCSDTTFVFYLPFNATASTLTCDFGVGGGIYGKLQAGSVEEFVWRTEFTETGAAQWSVATDGRTDYVGETLNREAFLPQRWFHLIDSDKSLAVAITDVPDACRELTVTLSVSGDVTIAFTLGAEVSGAQAFGVCYHFLNDIPPIAAATNPQSILLPPTVEVLAGV